MNIPLFSLPMLLLTLSGFLTSGPVVDVVDGMGTCSGSGGR